MAGAGAGAADPLSIEAVVERDAAIRRRVANFARLKRDERIALAMLALGYSYREIAELRGWSNTKINRCLSEGRAALRTMEGGENERPQP